MKSLLIFYLISNTIYQHAKQSSTRTRHVRLCLLFTNIFSIDIDFCFSPPVQRPRELLQSLGVRPWYVIYIRTSFLLKPLNQIKPNLAGMMLGWSDSPPFIQDGAVIKIKYFVNLNSSYIAMSSLTYIPGFSVTFFFQLIYTDYAN